MTMIAGETGELTGKWKDRKVRSGYMDPEQLQANPLNPRLHPANQQRIITDSLNKYGWFDEIKLQDGTDMIFNGHARVLQAISAGEPSVPVGWYDLSDSEMNEILSFLDPVAGLAVNDLERYSELMGEIASLDGMDNAIEEYINTARTETAKAVKRAERFAKQHQSGDDDEPEEDALPPVVSRGDVWIMGGHRLLVGDATDELSLRMLMGTDLAQLVFTDPPYGVGYVGGTKLQKALRGDGVENPDLYALFEAPFRLAQGYADGGVAVFVFYANKVPLDLLLAVKAYGFEIRNEIVWTKNMAQFGALGAQYKNQHEPILYCVHPKHSPRWFGPNNETTLWEADRSSTNTYHPTQKPVALAERAIRNHTEEGGIVVDLFGGGGSTLIASEKSGRRCRMMELDEKHAETIIKRYVEFTGDEATRENDGVAFSDLIVEAGA